MAEPAKPAAPIDYAPGMTELLNQTDSNGNAKKTIPAGRVPIITPDGSIGDIDAKDLRQGEESGYKQISPEQYFRAQNATATDAEAQEKFGPLAPAASAITAGTLGALRTATFGTSDQLFADLMHGQDPGSESKLAGIYDANPGAATVGGLAGALLPAGAVGAAGKVGRAGAAAVGLGEGLGARVATGAVAGALENAAYGAGERIGDAAIHDDPLTAESLFAGAGKDALLGGVLGGAGEGIAGLISGGVGKLRGTKADVPSAAIVQDTVQGQQLADRAATKNSMLDNVLELGIGKEKGETVQSYLQRQADDSLFRAAGANKKAFASMERYGGTSGAMEVIRRDIGKYLPEGASTEVRSLTPRAINEASENALKTLGPKYEGVLGKLDEVAAETGQSLKAADISTTFDDVIAKYSKEYGSKSYVRQLTEIKDEFAQVVGGLSKKEAQGAGKAAKIDALSAAMGITEQVKPLEAFAHQAVSFTELKKLISNIGKRAGEVSENSALLDLKAGLNDVMKSKGDAISAAGGEKFSKEYNTLDKEYAIWSTMRDVSSKGSAAASSSGMVGFASQRAAATGAIAGSIVGGPVGGLVGAGLGALAQKFVRRHGEAFAADLLDKVAKYGAVGTATESVTSSLRSAAKRAVHGGSEVATKSVAKQEVARIAADMRTIAKNPDALSARVSDFVKPIATAIPRLSTALSAVGSRAIQHLADTAPIPKMDNSFMAASNQPRYSDSDLDKYNDRIETIKDPHYAFAQLKDGKLTRETVAALQAVSPALFKQMQNFVMSEVADLKAQGRIEELAYAKRVQLSILLGIPADDTTQPDFIAMMQGIAKTGQTVDAQGKPRPASATKPVEMSQATAITETQRISEGID